MSDDLKYFVAMGEFLRLYWERGHRKDDNMASLLGAMSAGSGGMPIDRALWDDWQHAIDSAGKLSKDEQSRLKPSGNQGDGLG